VTSQLEDLDQTLARADSAFGSVQRVASSIEAGEGAVGRLLTDSTLAVRLENAAAQLDSLLAVGEANPGRYARLSLFSAGRPPGGPFAEPVRVSGRRPVEERSAGGIVFRARDGVPHVLLIRDPYRNWGLPKGHLENGEDEAAAALREVREETGLEHLELGPEL